MAKKQKQQAAAKGLGVMVFSRDPQRTGRTSRDGESVSVEEAKAVADRLKAPHGILPKPLSDQKVLGMIVSRTRAKFKTQGLVLRPGSRKNARAEVAVYQDEKQGAGRELLGWVCWDRNEAEIDIAWAPSREGKEDPGVTQYIRDRFDGERGRIPINAWADWLRVMALTKWLGLPARHEGRVYWIPEAFTPAVEQLGAVTEAVGVFSLVILPVPDSMAPVVESIILDNIGVELTDLEQEVGGLGGTEPLARYERMQRELQNVAKLIRMYTDVLVPLAFAKHGPALAQKADSLLRTVEEAYIKPYHEGRSQAGLQRSAPSAIRRKRYLDLPTEAPVPPPPTPIELAPRPEPYLVIEGLAFHINPKLSEANMTCFTAEVEGAADAIRSAFGELADKWSAAGGGHVFPWAESGPPRVYLTVVNADVANDLGQRLGVTLHV